MAQNPNAKVSIDDEAGAFAGGTGYCVVLSCAEKNADIKPRVFSSHKALLSQHGYTPGASYLAMHVDKTRKPVIFVGLPISTAGTIGRHDNTGVAGTSALSVAAGSNGVLEEVRGRLEVVTGGTVGTPGIVLDVSMDGGRNKKRVRLGTATTYTVPYVGLVVSFGAGTLIAGDVYTFATTAPRLDPTAIADAKTALAAQQKLARSVVIIGDLTTKAEVDNVTNAINAYETSNQRFTYARVQVTDGGVDMPTKSKITKRMVGTPTLTFAEVGASGDTITRSTGSWVDDGFAVGDMITVTGTVSNNVSGVLTAVSATVLTLDATDLAAETGPAATNVTASGTLTFAEVGATDDTITRSSGSGSWISDGFAVGDTVAITGTASNNVTGAIKALSATVLTFDTTDLVAEVIRSDKVTVKKVETKAAWISSIDTTFAGVDSQKRVDLAAGRARKQCPITGWALRRPAAWAASIREYEHDLQIPCWRKADGPLDGWDMADTDGTIVEYDETTDGGALAARFTCLRSYGNGPIGAFVALSMTRAPEASLLSRTHNMSVANHACTVTQAETENAIGQVLVLKADGKATEASLQAIEERVNTALEQELLVRGPEGQRASIARWAASRDNILNVPAAKLTGVLTLEVNGTLEQIETTVLIKTGG